MSVATNLVYRPILISQCQYPRLNKFSTFKLDFSRKCLSQTSISHFTKYPITPLMDSFKNKAVAGDEGLIHEGLEQEAFIDRSINFSSGRIQAILNSMSKWLMVTVFGILFLWRHDMEALWATTGAILNGLLATILKRILNQKRPGSKLRSDPGMPSSHAQSAFYIVTFFIISMVEYFGLNGITAVISAPIFAMGSYTIWLRVSQQLHTLNQVAVGTVLGSCFSIFWIWLWHATVMKAFIAHCWVRIVVVGSGSFCVGFVLHVFRTWIVKKG